MGVNHRGSDIAVTEEFLHCANVVACIEQMGGEGMTKSMATCWFGDSGLPDGLLHSTLNDSLVKVMALSG